MKLIFPNGKTDASVVVFVPANNSTTGAGLTGLAHNTASLTAYYVRPGSTAAALSLATQTVDGAHSDGGFVEVDATNMPGVYRLDLSDAILATGVDSAAVMLKGAANMAPVVLEIQLVDAALGALTTGERTSIADAVLSRDLDQVEASAPIHSLTGAALKLVSKVDDDGAGSLVTYRTDGSTAFSKQAITTGASLEPIDSLGTATTP